MWNAFAPCHELNEPKRMNNLNHRARSPAATADKSYTCLHWLKYYLLLGLAVLSLGVALLGVFLPGLPTIEFLLLAAWAAARSSPRLHGWMLSNRLIGPLLRQWQHGVLPRRAKWAASVSIVLVAPLLILMLDHLPSRIFSLLATVLVLAWIWRMPEHVVLSPIASRNGGP